MKIIICTLHNNFFVGNNLMGLDIHKIKTEIQKIGFINVDILEYKELIPRINHAENFLIIPSLSYNKIYQKYINDILSFLDSNYNNIKLFVSLEMIKSFENKGYQSLLMKKFSFSEIGSFYYGDFDDIDLNNHHFPFVFKTVDGAVSSGIFLIRNVQDFNQLKRKYQKKSIFSKARFTYWLMKKKKLNNRNYGFSDQSKLISFGQDRFSFVIQEFIPELECDYRLVYFGDRIFCYKRLVRENDFRASGSQKLVFEEIPEKILDFGSSLIKYKLSPLLSCDILFDKDENCHLIEFQALGFGPSAVLKSNFYYQKVNEVWTKFNHDSCLESQYVYAVKYWIDESN